MKTRWIFNALAVMEAVLCPVLCLVYAFCGLAIWTQTTYFCPLLSVVLVMLLFSQDKRRFIWKCAGVVSLKRKIFGLRLEVYRRVLTMIRELEEKIAAGYRQRLKCVI